MSTTPESVVATAAALVPDIFIEAAEVDADDGFPRRAIELLHRHRLLTAPLATELGGSGLGAAAERLALLEVLAHLGRGSLPVGRIYEGHVNALLLIDAYGDRSQLARAAEDAAAGHLFAVWNTEAHDGVVLQGKTLAGAKTFATGAGFVSRAVITAADADGGRQMLIVPVDAAPPRIERSFWRPLGMRSTASYRVDFAGIAIAREAWLGRPGDYYREPMFSTGAERFAAVQLGGAEAVFDETRAFLRRIGRTDDPFQRTRLGEMAFLIASGRHWLHAAARQAAPDAPSEAPAGRDAAASSVAFAHLMRSAIEEIGLRTLTLAERSVGARGLLRPEPFERLHRDLTHYLRQGAPDAALAAAGAHALARTEPAHALWTDGRGER